MVPDNVYTHTVDYYSALKKKEIVSYVTARMNFADIMLSEISHEKINTKSSTYIKDVKYSRNRKENDGCQGKGGGRKDEPFNSREFYFARLKKKKNFHLIQQL